ncbi:MAG TPA: ABC transporter substrate-binding protein [Chloroflexota bacterium]|nr:ABC transporter substrate-binding protein [Chloroflexota bacterium]
MRVPRLSGTPVTVVIALALLFSVFAVPRIADAHGPAKKRPPQTLTAAFSSDFPTLDPAVGYDPFSWTGEHALFNSLLGYKNAPGLPGTRLQPDVAASMPKISNGGKLYTFHLRHDVHFSPPVKRLVTASDFKYSIERALGNATYPMFKSGFWSPLSGTSAFWSKKAKHISGITVKGKWTIEFRLTSPDIAFQNVIAMPFASVVPKEWVKKQGGRFASDPVGTGPYMLKYWHKGSQMLLVKNPLYFHKGLPHVPRVLIDMNVPPHLQIQRAEKNQLDIPGDLVTSQDYLALRTGPYSKQLVHEPDIAVFYLAMNMQMKPFKGNLALRRAFNMAIDKNFIVRELNGRAVVMNGILPPTMPGANKHFTYYKYNLKAARAEFKKSGYKPGHLTVKLLYVEDNPDYLNVFLAVQSDLKKIGVNVQPNPQTQNNAYNLVYTPGKSAFSFFTWGEDYPDPSDFFDPILSCSASSNAAFFCNKAVDKLGNKARADTNRKSRYAMYRKMEKMVMAKAPWVPLYDDILYDFHSSKVQGFYIHPVWPFSYDQYRLKS